MIFASVQIEKLLLPLLSQLVLIILAARIVGLLFRKIGQPEVVGEITAGLLLGPSLFGWLAPDTFQVIFRPTLEGFPRNIALGFCWYQPDWSYSAFVSCGNGV